MQFWPPAALAAHNFGTPQMLVDPILPWGGLGLLHGPRTAGKSQLALALASAISTGQIFFGRYACTKARVCYIEVDMAPPLLQERVSLAGNALDEIGFVTSDRSFDVVELVRKGGVQSVPALVELRRFEPQLCIVDSLRKTHRLDENDSNTPDIVYSAWRQLVPNTALLFLHHDRKVVRGPMAGDVDEAFRGSSAWLDDLDTGLHLQRRKKERDFAAVLSFSKVRTAEPQPPLGVAMDPVTLLAVSGAPTPAQLLVDHLARVPADRTRRGAIAWLLQEKLCSRATAYRLANDLQLVP